jgi:hypothetical protein
MSPTPRDAPVVAPRPRPTSMVAKVPTGVTTRRSVVPPAAPRPPARFPKPVIPSEKPVAEGTKMSSRSLVVDAPPRARQVSMKETNKGHATQVLGLIKEIEGFKGKVCTFDSVADVAC